MENASASLSKWSRILGASLAAVVVAAPLAGPAAATAEATERLALPSPGIGCGPMVAGAALFERVRAEKPRAARRDRQAARRPRLVPPAPAPMPEEVAAGAFLHAFYTCAATTAPPAIRVGTGWLAVGPVRRS
jgi:hypothetical protein